ncbi:MAG: hypothetical protein H6810_09095 [Phycisphaeraceae bacterium]|nr:MAG: hypothetical protein H6810_09095 [Phycisphaeraceae bacterium]
MLHPAPTTKIDPGLARGVLEEVCAATATAPAHIVVSFYNTNYRVHLLPVGEITAEVGRRIQGVIRAEAKRVDVVKTGGKYIDPVYGRPRRVQGRIVETDTSRNTLTVDVGGAPFVCRLTDHRQRASDFEPGQFVGFGVLKGATFEQAP